MLNVFSDFELCKTKFEIISVQNEIEQDQKQQLLNFFIDLVKKVCDWKIGDYLKIGETILKIEKITIDDPLNFEIVTEHRRLNISDMHEAVRIYICPMCNKKETTEYGVCSDCIKTLVSNVLNKRRSL